MEKNTTMRLFSFNNFLIKFILKNKIYVSSNIIHKILEIF